MAETNNRSIHKADQRNGEIEVQNQKLWTRDFVFVCLSSFFLFMTFYILAVTLPIYVKEDLGGGEQDIGLTITVFIISTILLRPIAGKWIDQYNPRKLVLLALGLFFSCTVLYLGVQSLLVLLLLRFIHGIGFGSATTMTGAMAIQLIPDSRKGEGVGYFGLCMSLAMVLGPFFGLIIIDHFNYIYVLYVCILFSLLSFLFGVSVQTPKRAPLPKAEETTGWRSYIEPKAIPIALAGLMLAFSYCTIATFISVYAKEIGLASSASYFFVVFAAVIILSRPFTGKLLDCRGENILVYPAILLFSLGMVGLSQVQSITAFLIAGGIIGLGYGALIPSFQTIAIKAAPKHKGGLATGTFFLFFDTGYGLGSYVLGLIAGKTNYQTMFLVAGLAAFSTLALYYFLHHKQAALPMRHPVKEMTVND